MKEIYTIGRDETCDIVVPDTSNIVSRLHATVRIDSHNRLFITDKSRNGTYVNGMKMSSNVEIPVSRNDVVSFAHIYDLDWTQIPKHKNMWFVVGGIICLVLVIVGFGLCLKLNRSVPVVPDKEVTTPDPIPVKPMRPVSKDTVTVEEKKTQQTDTMEVCDKNVKSKPDKKVSKKTKTVKKDTVTLKESKKTKEIYHPNPLY